MLVKFTINIIQQNEVVSVTNFLFELITVISQQVQCT